MRRDAVNLLQAVSTGSGDASVAGYKLPAACQHPGGNLTASLNKVFTKAATSDHYCCNSSGHAWQCYKSRTTEDGHQRGIGISLCMK